MCSCFYQPPPGRVVVVVELSSVVVVDSEVDVELLPYDAAETLGELGKPKYNIATALRAPTARKLIARRLLILESGNVRFSSVVGSASVFMI